MRVAGLGYSDGARNLEVMLKSLSGGRRWEIQEDGIVIYIFIGSQKPSHNLHHFFLR